MTYQAKDLNQVADLFEDNAKRAESACNAQLITKRAIAGFKGEATAYRACANILRSTVLTQS